MRGSGELCWVGIVACLAMGIATGATARRPDQESDACAVAPPAGHSVQAVGYGWSPRKAEAFSRARADARAGLVQTICAGLDELQCDVLRRHIKEWKGEYDPARKSACAVAAIPDGALDRLPAEARRLEEGIAALAATVAGRGVTLVRAEDPVWASACSAGAVGTDLRAALEGALGRHGVRTGAQGTPLRLQLTAGVEVRVMAYLGADDGSEIPLAGPSFPHDLLSVEPAERGDCLGDDSLGLEHGRRVGDGGLSVSVVLDGGRNTFCEGEAVAAELWLSSSARVHVYSVEPDGRAHLIYPGEADKRVSGTVDLGTFTAVAGAGRDERLVAVAVPADGSFGLHDEWHGYCLAGDDFGPLYYPRDAAVGTATFHVRAQGSDGCPWIDDPEDRKLLEDAREDRAEVDGC